MNKSEQTLKWVPIVICLLISVAFALMPKASSAGMQTIPEGTQIALITRIIDHFNEKLGEVKPQSEEIIVYITKTGSKYHRAGCKHLKKSSIPITLEEAKERGYTPCKVCNPPT